MCVQYIGGIPWVHWEDIMSTSGGVQYISGISWVHREMFSTSEGYHVYIGGYHKYIGGIMIHVGGYHEYIGGYHEYIGGISWVHWGMFSTLGFSIEIEMFLPTCSPTCIMISPDVLNIPRRTHDITRCTHGIPPMYWTSPDVLMISPTCIRDIPWCTEHPWCTHDIPPMYWTPPDVLNTHYTGWLLSILNQNFKWNPRLRTSDFSGLQIYIWGPAKLHLQPGHTCVWLFKWMINKIERLRNENED